MKRQIAPIALVAALGFSAACASVPDSKTGPEAEALAEKLLERVNYSAWQNETAAVRFDFSGLGVTHSYVWDKGRKLVQVEWDEIKVQYSLEDMRGRSWEEGVPVEDGETNWENIQQANEYFVNDSFWLNPLFHISSPGAERSITADGSLVVKFSSGGVTPGDVYVFIPGEDEPVDEIHMWVDIVPIPGAEADMGGWTTSETGVQFPTDNDFLVDTSISNAKMYPRYPAPGEDDVFADFPAK